MEFPQLITALLFALALARIEPSACQLVKGRVFCIDCTHNYDLSGIKVSVKCENVKNLAVATSEHDGSFRVNLPSDHTKSSAPSVKCVAKLLGGPKQLYASRKNTASQIVKGKELNSYTKGKELNSYTKGKELNSYTISTPLSFFISCPRNTKCKAVTQLGSSKTVDLPLPREWGLAPSSYYVPFFPIIGIP